MATTSQTIAIGAMELHEIVFAIEAVRRAITQNRYLSVSRQHSILQKLNKAEATINEHLQVPLFVDN